jgi:hypothetical protein
LIATGGHHGYWTAVAVLFSSFLVMLEILDRALVGFGGFPFAERAEVAPASSLGILFAGI